MCLGENVDYLLRRLQSSSAVERNRAAIELGRFSFKSEEEKNRAIRALIERLQNDPNELVRRAVAMSLGRIGGRDAIEALDRAMREDRSPYVRTMARARLTNLLDRLIRVIPVVSNKIIPPRVWYSVPVSIRVEGDVIKDITLSFSGTGIRALPAEIRELRPGDEVRAEVDTIVEEGLGPAITVNLTLSYKDRLGRKHVGPPVQVELDLRSRPPVNIDVPGYRLEYLLGSGQSGNVWLARAVGAEKKAILEERGLSPDDLVAIKVPRTPSLVYMDEKVKNDFREEASIWSKLDHPHIVKLVDFGLPEEGGANVPYLVMELMPGGTLRRLLEKQVLDWVSAAKISVSILKALEHAHGKLKAHRDIKPENVLMTDIDVSDPSSCLKVSDWGLAKMSTFSSLAHEFKGTPDYAAPEQWLEYYLQRYKVDKSVSKDLERLCQVLEIDVNEIEHPGELIDKRVDIYQTGAVLYEMLTGRTPMMSKRPEEIRETLKPAPPSQLNPDVPPALDQVVLKALEKRKEDRYQRAEDMKKAILEVLASR